MIRPSPDAAGESLASIDPELEGSGSSLDEQAAKASAPTAKTAAPRAMVFHRAIVVPSNKTGNPVV